MKYAHIQDNKIKGWYDSNIHTKIPIPKIEVSNDVWQEAISINANYYDDGVFSYVESGLTDAQILASKVNEALAYLSSTDYKMTVDYFATLTELEQTELTDLRSEARQFVRDNQIVKGEV